MLDADELDYARVEEAKRRTELPGIWPDISLIAARLAREGWTPPKAVVDPDLAEATILYNRHHASFEGLEETLFTAIKRGRELERAEAKTGMVWVKHDGSTICPVDRDAWVLTKNFGYTPCFSMGKRLAWQTVTHYAIITPPEDK